MRSQFSCFLFVALIIACLTAVGQVEDTHCATVPFNERIRQTSPQLPSDEQFEEWMSDKLKERQRRSRRLFYSTQAATYTVPVVVHVVHSGEPVGSGANISLAQIQSQISVINEDFRRLNPDAGSTPAEFQSVAGVIDIEFVLAQTDPYGLPTNGVVRVQGSRSSWSESIHSELAAQSYWPAEDYLNVWVCNLDVLGYAKFPESTLPGLAGLSNTNPLTDGVVVKYNVFGSIDDGAFILNPNYNKGRTLSHELGHFFGLRHIWGDGSSCAATDYVDDTPPQIGSTDFCPAHPQAVCTTNKMFQNYMDYSYDACMNLFTVGQFGRVQVVIENSPRRASLLTSPGSQPPSPTANDLGLALVVNPTASTCATLLAPVIQVVNPGSNTITSTTVEVTLNGSTVLTAPFSINLAPGNFQYLSFASINLTTEGPHNLEFNVISTNGVGDSNADNNSLSVTTILGSTDSVPFEEKFSVTPVAWTSVNPDGDIGWSITAANNGVPGNNAAFINLAAYPSVSEQDLYISPTFDFSSVPTATLSFDRAYAPFPFIDEDELRILVQTDCQDSPLNGTEIFSKSGTALATRPATTADYFPAGAGDWQREIISLDAFLGQPAVRIVFVVRNGNGNNLFIDNVNIESEIRDDVSLISVDAPSPVVCPGQYKPLLTFRNTGTRTVNTLELETTLGSDIKTKTLSLLDLSPGDSLTVEGEPHNFLTGQSSFTATFSDPNGNPDDTPGDNSQSFTVVVNGESDGIPVRKNFDSGIAPGWSTVTRGTGSSWETGLTNFANSARFPGFDDTSIGTEAWLVSPILDVSQVEEASVFFDRAYSYLNGPYETLRILSSTNCGLTFPTVLYEKSESELETTSSEPDFTPSSEADWIQDYLDLVSLVGEPTARIAFVVTNGNGNNLYLDNIEFFSSSNPFPPEVQEPFQIYYDPFTSDDFYITFNLANKADVGLQIFDASGRQMVREVLPSSLNQTHPVRLLTAHTGLHIVLLDIEGQSFPTKVMIYR